MIKKTRRIFPLFALSLGLLVALSGCSSRITPASPAVSQTYALLTGSWLFSSADTNFSIDAGLSGNAGAVTGTATVHGCSGTPEQTTLSGPVSTTGTMTLRTAKLAGGEILSLHGQLSPDGKTISNATVTTSGSGCAVPAGEMLRAQVYAPATGNYSGTFTGSDNVAIAVTATLSQNTIAGPGGSYSLSGTVNFPASPCLGNIATINSASSTVTSGTLSAAFNTTVSGQPVTVNATGTADPSADTVTISQWTISGGSCDTYSGTGSLSNQP